VRGHGSLPPKMRSNANSTESASRSMDLSKSDEEPAKPGRSPVVPDMLSRALRHHRAGRLRDAARIYRQILGVDAQQADSLHLLGMIAHQAGGDDLAVTMIRKAVAINGQEAVFHANLGTVLQAQNKPEEAAACYRQALVLKPDLAEVHVNLGNLFQSQGRLDEAAACYARALAFSPGLAEAHHSLGNVLQGQEKPDEAAECYERALALTPNYARAHYNLGCVLRALGKVDEALARFKIAVALQPDYSQAGFSVSLAQLLKGDFAAGWHNYEKRWQSEDHHTPRRNYSQPFWAGERLLSGRLLIWGEQGVGDEIMFAGLIPDVIRTNNCCVLDCDVRLQPLFARSFPEVDVISSRADGYDFEHDPERKIAAQLPCASLPGLFRSSSTAFAATKWPYLIADPAEREKFRARYRGGLRNSDRNRLIGLAWHTNNRKTGSARSIDLSWLSPLLARQDICWVSLQYGDHAALESQAAAANARIHIDRSVDQLANVDLLAAQVAAMDMVITIDNSTAHLAGALGVHTWVLLPFAPDWRWLLEREDSPWYPTLRLFRQPKRGDWQSVVQRVWSLL
jgi:tetratricopeptide (TPR) repeat protein